MLLIIMGLFLSIISLQGVYNMKNLIKLFAHSFTITLLSLSVLATAHAEKVELNEKSLSPEEREFFSAVKSGDNKRVEEILSKEDIDLNIQNERGLTALMIAAELGHERVVESLLKHGADPNIESKNIKHSTWDQSTALHTAVRKGNVKLIKILYDYKADLDKGDWMDYTALNQAAAENNENVVQTLLKLGADPNKENELKETTLHEAARMGHTNMIIALVTNGANIDAKGREGQTALHWAAWNGHAGLVQALLKLGADSNIQDDKYRIALDFAITRGYKGVEDILRKHKAVSGANNSCKQTISSI